MGIGVGESIVLLIIALLIIFPIWLSIYLGKKLPGKQWLGILLSVIFGPSGQFYLEGALGYFIALVVLAGISRVAMGGPLLAFAASPFVMWYRFSKASLNPTR